MGLNVLSMTLPHTLDSEFGSVWENASQHSKFHSGLDILNVIATFFFLLELVLKIWGWGLRVWARSVNNLFHLLIVVLSESCLLRMSHVSYI